MFILHYQFIIGYIREEHYNNLISNCNFELLNSRSVMHQNPAKPYFYKFKVSVPKPCDFLFIFCAHQKTTETQS